MSSNSSSAVAVKEESGIDRIVDSHFLLIFSLLLGMAGVLFWYLEIPLFSQWVPWIMAAGVVMFVASFFVDPLIAVWSRWPVVAGDAGLLGRREGVPSRWLVYPTGWRSVALVTSSDSILSEEWQRAAPSLAQGYGYDRCSVDVNRHRAIVKFTNTPSPIEQDLVVPLKHDGMKVYLGIDESGEDFWFDSTGHSGMMVSGVPGSGKTVMLRRYVDTLRDIGLTEVFVFDGKGTADLNYLDKYNVRVFSGTPENSEDVLEGLRMVRDRLHEARGVKMNGDPRLEFDLDLGDEPKPSEKIRREDRAFPEAIIVIDECQGFFPVKGLSKEENKAREEASQIIRECMALGRSLGFFTVLATQKPAAEAIPTVVRDNAVLRASGRLRTIEAEKMAFGEVTGDTLHLGVGQMVFDDGTERTKVKISQVPEPIRDYQL